MLKNVSNTKTLISEIIKAIEKVKGVNISLLDFCSLENTICNYFIICDGGSNTHVNAIVNSIKKSVSNIKKGKIDNTLILVILVIGILVIIFFNRTDKKRGLFHNHKHEGFETNQVNSDNMNLNSKIADLENKLLTEYEDVLEGAFWVREMFV